MRTNTAYDRLRRAALFSLLIAVVAGTAALAGQGVVVEKVSFSDNFVVLDLANTSEVPRTVVVEAVVALEGGATAQGLATLMVPARGSVNVGMGFAGPVDEVMQVGIKDEGNPW